MASNVAEIENLDLIKQGKKTFAPSVTKGFKAEHKEFLTLEAKRLQV